jgi:hypothetical protein
VSYRGILAVAATKLPSSLTRNQQQVVSLDLRAPHPVRQQWVVSVQPIVVSRIDRRILYASTSIHKALAFWSVGSVPWMADLLMLEVGLANIATHRAFHLAVTYNTGQQASAAGKQSSNCQPRHALPYKLHSAFACQPISGRDYSPAWQAVWAVEHVV